MAVGALLALSSLPACTGWTSTAVCVPMLAVSPDRPHPGDTIVVETRVPCAVAAPDGGWIVDLHPVGDLANVVRTSVAPETDGSFRVSLSVPTTMEPGEAVASISNWDYSRCADAGGSCASASVGLTVVGE